MGNSSIEDMLFQKLNSGEQIKNKGRSEKSSYTDSKQKKKHKKKSNALSLSDILGTSESSELINHHNTNNHVQNYDEHKDDMELEPRPEIQKAEKSDEEDNNVIYYQSEDTAQPIASHQVAYTHNTTYDDSDRIVQFKSSFRLHKLVHFVADTNFLIDNLSVIEMMDKIEAHFLSKNRSILKVCVVDTVLSELDHLKQPRRRSSGSDPNIDTKTQELKMKAINANRYIYDKITTSDVDTFVQNKTFQVISRGNLKKEIKRYSKQLKIPYDFQDDYMSNNDDKILDSSLKLQEVLEFQHDINSDYEFTKDSEITKYSLLPPSSVVVLTNDKNFCIKLISSNLKTISLPSEEIHSNKEVLINTKVLILKCLQGQIKSLIFNWPSMIMLNLFELFLLDSNLNRKMLEAYDHLLNGSHGTPVDDMNYLKKTSHLFSVNNITKAGVEDLLDDTPDLKLIFSILNREAVSFQSASCQTMNSMGIYNIDYNKALELVNILFFNDTESFLDRFIETLIDLVKRDLEKGKLASAVDLLLNFNGYLMNINNVSECWKLYLTSLADGIESVYISNFKLKLDVMWKDVVDLLSDLLFLSELSAQDFN